MSHSRKDWVGELYSALTLWQQKQYLPAQSAFHRAEDLVAGQESGLVWTCLLAASVSRLLLEMGDYREAEVSIARAREVYSEQRYGERLIEIQPHLQYFAQLARQAGLSSEADLFDQTVASAQAVFLGIHEAASPFDPRSNQRDTGLAQGEILLPTLGGSAKGHSLSWEEATSQGFTEAIGRQATQMAFSLDEARQRANQHRSKDQGLRLILSSWLETICYFLVGDYGSSTRSAQDIPELWLSVSLLPQLEHRPEVRHLYTILRPHDFGYLVEKLVGQLHRRECPTIDPWTDLKVQFAQLDRSSQALEYEEFERRLAGALCALSGQSRGSIEFVPYRSIRDPQLDSDLRALLAGFDRRREELDGDGERAGHALLLHVLSHVAWAQNLSNRGQLLEADAQELWQEVSSHERNQGAYSQCYQRAVDEAGLAFWLANFPEQLESARSQVLGMAQMAGGPTGLVEDLDFWGCLKQVVAELQAQQFTKAERLLLSAKGAEHRPSERLMLAYLHNLQSVIDFQRGDVAAGQESWHLSQASYPALTLESDKIHEQCWVGLFRGSAFENIAEKLRQRQASSQPLLVDPQADLSTIALPTWAPPSESDSAIDYSWADEVTAQEESPKGAVSKMLGWFRKA